MPVNAVLVVAVIGVILTLPALYKAPNGAPVAFYAVVSIGVIGLYVAFAIPIFLRWRLGDSFEPGSVERSAPSTSGWTRSRSIEIVIIVDLLPPAVHARRLARATPTSPGRAVNYTPIVIVGVLIAAHDLVVSSRRRTGSPGRSAPSTCPPGVVGADEIALEHEHHGYLTGEHDKP